MGDNTTPKCSCEGCNNIGRYAYPIRRRGNGNAYLCDFHQHSLESYYRKNTFHLGTPKANGMTYSIELETMNPQFQARIELCIAGFLPTSDCTVDAEFKSPIYEGMNAVKAYLPTIQWLIDNGQIVIDSHCGTHFHAGHKDYINELYMDYIRRFYHSLFVPLSDALVANDAKATEIFGRGFGDWNERITTNTPATRHTNFINTQHDNTLEFRRMFFKNAAQYSRGCDFCRKVTDTVIKGFCVKVETLGLMNGQSLTIEQKTALKKAADKTAQKLVKLFEEF